MYESSSSTLTPIVLPCRTMHHLVEASFMMMNQAILMMPKAQLIDSRLIQDFKIKHQESNPRFKRRNQEATCQDFI